MNKSPIDDRGRTPSRSASAASLLSASPSLRAKLGSKGHSLQKFTLLCVPCVLIIVLTRIFEGRTGATWGTWLHWLLRFGVVLTIIWAVMAWLHVMNRSTYVSRERSECKKDGLCPSCGYDIRPTIVESDGCRICPECSGAWNLDLIGDPS